MPSSSANLPFVSGDERQHDTGNQITADRVPAESAPIPTPEQNRFWEWWESNSVDAYLYEQRNIVKRRRRDAKRRRGAEVDVEQLATHCSEMNFLSFLKSFVSRGFDEDEKYDDLKGLVECFRKQLRVNSMLREQIPRPEPNANANAGPDTPYPSTGVLCGRPPLSSSDDESTGDEKITPAAAIPNIAVAAVSYTHLTLPTKRIV